MRSTPIALFGLTLIAYAPLLPWLGFFWDDWPKAWFLHLFGPAGFNAVYAVDRPFLGWVYLLTTPWIGERPLAWQVFGLVCRGLSGLALAWSMGQVFPGKARVSALTAMLFVVYPGFGQQSVSLIFSHYLLLLAGHIASIGIMVGAVRRAQDSLRSHLASLALAGVSLFSLEYFLGLELLRPLILLFVLPRDRSRASRFLRVGIPYAVLTAGYLAWRVWAVSFPTYEPSLLQELSAAPGAVLPGLIQTVASDIAEAGLGAWAAALVPKGLPSLGGLSVAGFAAVFAAAFAIAAIHTRSLTRSQIPSGDAAAVAKFLVLGGVLSLALAGWPFWIPQLPLQLQFPWDRLTLPMMLGSSLVIAGLLEWVPLAWGRILLTALLVGAGAAHQFQNATLFRRDWYQQREFLWQLAWRAPAIRPGTVLLTNDLPFAYESDNSLTAPVNWIYAPDSNSARMDYILYFVSVRLGRGWPGYEPGLPVHQTYRAAHFDGSTSAVMALFYDPPGCLRLLDLPTGDSMHNLPPLLSQALPLSDLSRVEADPALPATPAAHVVGPEPPHGWCYYFEKADLARQSGNWSRIVELGAAAFALLDRPNDAAERIPFLEGYAHEGDLERARALSLESLDQEPAVRPMLCHAWDRVAAEFPPADPTRVAAIQLELGCEP